MLPRLHVGVTVWPARSDFFYYLRNWVAAHSSCESYRKLSLPPNLLTKVSRLEYSPFWMFRAIRYIDVARYLEREIAAIMKEAQGKFRQVVFYLPDDGYWAELFETIRRRVTEPFKIFNVQHGQPTLVARPQRLRRLFNRISVMLMGYPNFGYGFGAGTLDGYIVMSEHEREFIEKSFGTLAYVAPQFVRGDFFAAALEVESSSRSEDKLRILFAMNPVFAKKSNLFGARARAEAQFFADIADSLRAIAAAVPCEIRFRFHPGQDRKVVEPDFCNAGLNEIAIIDDSYRILDSLINSDFILAYGSTVLFEAALLGKVPVNFVPVAYPPSWALTFRAETLFVRRLSLGHVQLENQRGSLRDLFSREVIEKYGLDKPSVDYRAPLAWLD